LGDKEGSVRLEKTNILLTWRFFKILPIDGTLLDMPLNRVLSAMMHTRAAEPLLDKAAHIYSRSNVKI
jgi:hypothetical protein